MDEPAHAPPAWDAPAAITVHYLRAAPLDNAGNQGEWRTIAEWRYDDMPPSATVQVNGGGETVRSLNVTLNLTAEDNGSGVEAMRFSTDSAAWTPWEPYAPYRTWQIEDMPGPQAVYAQVRDVAGNMSEAAHASVTAVLNVELPSSASYRIARSVLGMGGGVKTSVSYRVQGTSGQLSGTGVLTSSSYRVRSGFWAGMTCPLAELAAAPDIGVMERSSRSSGMQWRAPAPIASIAAPSRTSCLVRPTTAQALRRGRIRTGPEIRSSTTPTLSEPSTAAVSPARCIVSVSSISR